MQTDGSRNERQLTAPHSPKLRTARVGAHRRQRPAGLSADDALLEQRRKQREKDIELLRHIKVIREHHAVPSEHARGSSRRNTSVEVRPLTVPRAPVFRTEQLTLRRLELGAARIHGVESSSTSSASPPLDHEARSNRNSDRAAVDSTLRALTVPKSPVFKSSALRRSMARPTEPGRSLLAGKVEQAIKTAGSVKGHMLVRHSVATYSRIPAIPQSARRDSVRKTQPRLSGASLATRRTGVELQKMPSRQRSTGRQLSKGTAALSPWILQDLAEQEAAQQAVL
ncbi:hypothetical protein FVE85_8393 [Porphyridium purpureum]|uniref:Uncharacterized protein n=1 Tax=Porphyridium purpureum TaxID=35688 RepID=A0A5J4YKC8_PORPP|nr:hypothetical protein FVE85_8393 [Porphyridium purpureum]|eukprot:POR8753..scf244_11